MAHALSSLLRPVGALLGGTIAFNAGNSLLGVVLPLRMEAAGHPVWLTGVVMAAFYLGLALGGLRAKRVILRIGHIRAFAAFAAITAASCLAYGLSPSPLWWMMLRIVGGFCIAGMTTAIESWLNERSANETRGRVLGFYMLTFYLAVAAGQTMVNLAPVGGEGHLMIAAALIGLSLVPVALTRLGEPSLREVRVLDVAALFSVSRTGVAGAGVAGMIVGSFYSLGIVFARQSGFGVPEAALLVSTVVMGGLAFQVPVGLLADRIDRHVLLAGLLLAVGATWGLLSFSIWQGAPYVVTGGLALVFGGAISSLYPLCVAQTFDRMDRRYYVAASGRLLMVYSIGAVIGPVLASAAMSAFGTASFFVLESSIAMAFAIAVLWRARNGRARPTQNRRPFVPFPDGAPVATGLDPRTDPGESDDMTRDMGRNAGFGRRAD
ncbi:major facilitator superfamily protein [Oceaniovalibus guishaninsula JLT2003]|uniref:Major facilitator superfamily protein n=1 Tax=Oceaniovalibus guishaninsula JLT2003 TaxID=1231392 RepID=K2HJK0_9RHOB|nr:MFS transporter [Oceaniovalibus guishaninsula]EKE43149.1 major facilitator superfamily protein [Oceaniovalibus guishaninsula JLT2003]